MAGYKKKVVEMKNGQGKARCVIIEEKNGQTCMLYRNKSDVYAYTEDERYVKGVPFNKGYVFEKLPAESIKAVVADEDGERFVGYLGKVCELKAFDEKEKTEKTEEKEEAADKYSSVKKEYEEMKKEETAAENFRRILDMFSREMKDMESENVIAPEEAVYINTGRKNTAEERLFETCSPLVPFEDSGFDWVMVSMDDMRTTSVKSRSLINDMVMLAQIKYHHLALGRNRNDGRYVFAVPEKFAPEDKKCAKELGFNDFWFCSRENSPFGYWIMYI